MMKVVPRQPRRLKARSVKGSMDLLLGSTKIEKNGGRLHSRLDIIVATTGFLDWCQRPRRIPHPISIWWWYSWWRWTYIVLNCKSVFLTTFLVFFVVYEWKCILDWQVFFLNCSISKGKDRSLTELMWTNLSLKWVLFFQLCQLRSFVSALLQCVHSLALLYFSFF